MYIQELCQLLQDLAFIEGLNQFSVRTNRRSWDIWYAGGYLQGLGWESFVAAHELEVDDTLIFSVDVDLCLKAMVFDQYGCERVYFWYIDIENDPLF